MDRGTQGAWRSLLAEKRAKRGWVPLFSSYLTHSVAFGRDLGVDLARIWWFFGPFSHACFAPFGGGGDAPTAKTSCWGLRLNAPRIAAALLLLLIMRVSRLIIRNPRYRKRDLGLRGFAMARRS